MQVVLWLHREEAPIVSLYFLHACKSPQQLPTIVPLAAPGLFWHTLSSAKLNPSSFRLFYLNSSPLPKVWPLKPYPQRLASNFPGIGWIDKCLRLGSADNKHWLSLLVFLYFACHISDPELSSKAAKITPAKSPHVRDFPVGRNISSFTTRSHRHKSWWFLSFSYYYYYLFSFCPTLLHRDFLVLL